MVAPLPVRRPCPHRQVIRHDAFTEREAVQVTWRCVWCGQSFTPVGE